MSDAPRVIEITGIHSVAGLACSRAPGQFQSTVGVTAGCVGLAALVGAVRGNQYTALPALPVRDLPANLDQAGIAHAALKGLAVQATGYGLHCQILDGDHYGPLHNLHRVL